MYLIYIVGIAVLHLLAFVVLRQAVVNIQRWQAVSVGGESLSNLDHPEPTIEAHSGRQRPIYDGHAKCAVLRKATVKMS